MTKSTINLLLITIGKLISKFFQSTNLGNGSTWPGHIALSVNKDFIREVLSTSDLRIILIAGTNGKTTTAKLIRIALEANGRKVIQNQAGANLLNGIASTLILNAKVFPSFSSSPSLSPRGRVKSARGLFDQDFALFEIDENTLPLILHELKPDVLLLTNLFRDQLDRYGEVDSIARKWSEAIKPQPLLSSPYQGRNNNFPPDKGELKGVKGATIILNADDPQVAYLGKGLKTKIIYFGLEKKELLLDSRFRGNDTPEHAADSIYCPECGNKLKYKTIYFSHLGDWLCEKCGLKRTKPGISEFSNYPLSGTYNRYNTLAAVSVLQQIGLDDKQIVKGFSGFQPAFGRQEKLQINGKQVQIFLSKNPTGFNESLRTVRELGAKTILLVLNDRIADGRDVSWIWDIDMEEFADGFESIFISVTGRTIWE